MFPSWHPVSPSIHTTPYLYIGKYKMYARWDDTHNSIYFLLVGYGILFLSCLFTFVNVTSKEIFLICNSLCAHHPIPIHDVIKRLTTGMVWKHCNFSLTCFKNGGNYKHVIFILMTTDEWSLDKISLHVIDLLIATCLAM